MMALANVAARLRLPRAIVLDLRTEAELTTAPAVCNVLGLNVATTDEVPGAIEAAVKSGQLPDKFAPIIVYCRYGPCSGRRAGVACEMLLQLGFFIVANGGSRETMATSCKMAGATASPNRILFSSRH
jgi:rhodanese-related sulfurtransferase